MRVVWLCAVLLPLAARAADAPTMPPGLLALLSRPDHRAALLQAAKAAEIAPFNRCANPSYVTSGEVALLQPLRLDAHGQPVAGAWKESVNEAGCEAGRLLNALTIVRPNGTLETRPLLPGTTITDPQLQQDSVQYAAAGLGEMPVGCDQGGIVDTAFDAMDGEAPGAKPPAGDMLKPWTETWTLQACSKRAEVVMHFTPGPAGTEIQAEPVKAP